MSEIEATHVDFNESKHEEKKWCTAIVLAAGQGKRMGTKVAKQYLLLAGKPILYYALKAFEDSPLINEVFLVTGEGEESYCREEIIEKYQFKKVSKVLQGGKERYHSVWNGLKELGKSGYVFIHDGARPFVERQIIERGYNSVQRCNACVVGMPVKDTIKQVDETGMVETTPDRSRLWMVQTPQIFENEVVKKAYSLLMRETCINVTDDAMVVEQMLSHPVRLVEGSYENMKITTPEDLEMAEIFLKRREK